VKFSDKGPGEYLYFLIFFLIRRTEDGPGWKTIIISTKAKEGPYLACVQKIRYDNSKVCGQRYAVVVIADDVRDNYWDTVYNDKQKK
jgi:hypothetical protein